MQPYQPTGAERAFLVIAVLLFFPVLVGSAMLVRQNLRLGRGDRRGAFRLAAFVFAAWAVAGLFGAHHVTNLAEFQLFMEFLLTGLAWSCLIWILYIALEPYVRRRWPATLVSWSRLLAGDFRDPLVGRDVLIGCLSAASTTAIGTLLWFIPSWIGHAPSKPFFGPTWQFLGARTIIAGISQILFGAPIFWLAALFVLVLLRALLRKDSAAAVAFFLLLGVFAGALSGLAPAVLVGNLIFSGVAVFLLIRFGLLTMVAHDIFWSVLETFPLTAQGSAWYAGISLAGILLLPRLRSLLSTPPGAAGRLSEVPRWRGELPRKIAPSLVAECRAVLYAFPLAE